VKLPAYPTYKPSGVEWLGEVPEEWSLTRLKYVLDGPLKYGANEAAELDDPDLPRYVRITDIDEADGLREETFRSLPIDVASEYLLREGDVLFARSGATAGKSFRYKSSWGTCAYAGYLIRARLDGNRVRPDFVRYFTASANYWQWISSSLIQATIQNVSADKYASLWLPLPSLDDQQRIASFLDRETGKIDTLVAKKRTLVERLKEKRTALISRTVTRGLPPDAARAAGLDPHPKLKPCGIDWLGDIPAHWEVLPFTKYVADKSDYRGKTPEKTEDGVFLVTAKNVRMGFIDYETSQEYVAPDEYDEIMRRGLPKKGDILFTTEAPLGNVALVDREDVALAQRIIRFRMNPARFSSGFTLYAMMSDHFQVQLQSLSTGSTAEGLKASKLPILRIIDPPLEEQKVIASFLDRETVRIDQMVAKVESVIERLQEYRTALITAAVTGKIDVRGSICEVPSRRTAG
jgi:type I restriction enzyme S subunit